MNEVPLEHIEAVAFADALKWMHLPCWHIKNENTVKNFGHIGKMKSEGWNPGVADYFVVIPSTKSKNKQTIGLFIELKRQKRTGEKGQVCSSPSTVSPEQISFIELTKLINGIDSTIAYGAEEAIYFIKKYLK